MDVIIIGGIIAGFLVCLIGLATWSVIINDENEQEMNRIFNRWPKDGE